MPVSDASYLLRDGSSNLDANENGSGVFAGPSPAGGMKLRISVPAAGGTSPTLDLKLQESDALGSGYNDIPGQGAHPQISAAGYYELFVKWTKNYIRHVATLGGTSPDFGAVTIGLTPGQIIVTGS